MVSTFNMAYLLINRSQIHARSPTLFVKCVHGHMACFMTDVCTVHNIKSLFLFADCFAIFPDNHVLLSIVIFLRKIFLVEILKSCLKIDVRTYVQ